MSSEPQRRSSSPPVHGPRLLRVRDGAMLGGVCAGIARFFGLDASLVRVLWILSVLFLGAGVFVYVVFWVVMPREGDS